jgi:Arylsulfotransferase (ASST)
VIRRPVALAALSSAATLAFGAQPILARRAALHIPPAPRCVPASLNRSALLPGTQLAVSPLPGSYDASPDTQVSLLGAPPGALAGVSVRGSQSGPHGGRLAAYSQGDGASFVPSRPFRPGETVTVSGELRAGAGAPHALRFRFVVAHPDPIAYALPAPHPPRDPNEMQHFHSRPDLLPPAVAVPVRSAQAAPGDVFAAPYAGPGPSGAMILDEAGELVWFDPLPAGIEATNLQVQRYDGKPVLTWWQGHIVRQGFGEGEEMIDDSSYRQIGRVRAGNGYRADLHDFHLGAGGTALLTVFDPLACDLSALGGPRSGAVTDSGFQEIDLRTGLVRREWHGLDHVSLGDSYSSLLGANGEWPFDFLHINSVEALPGERTLISARNMWALYELNSSTGQVLTRIGGRHSDVKLGSGAGTAFQHDAEMQPNGNITVFDNGGFPKVHPQSRALVVSVNAQAKTDTLVTQYEHPRPLLAGSQGNVQALPGGDLFVGWGSEPYFSELSAAGAVLFDAYMHGSYQSYRAYRFPWSATPTGAPAIAATASASGPVTVFASWNGATAVASWRVLAGPSPTQLAPVAATARSGFETALGTPGPQPYVAVQALDGAGGVLGTSRTVRARP